MLKKWTNDNDLAASAALSVDVAARIRHILPELPVDLDHIPRPEPHLVVLPPAASQAALKAVPVGFRVPILIIVLLHVRHHVPHIRYFRLKVCPEHHCSEDRGKLADECDGEKDGHDSEQPARLLHRDDEPVAGGGKGVHPQGEHQHGAPGVLLYCYIFFIFFDYR